MIYLFDDFELDTRLFELRHVQAVVPIEPRVFDFLRHLIENRDRVVLKAQLLERLWPDRAVSEATLSQCARAARKAVGDSGRAQRVIRTYHGRGYRFVAELVLRASAPPLHGYAR